MAAIRRNPLAAGLVVLLIGSVVVFGVFLTLLRSIGSDPSPGLLSAQGMAHRLLVGRESLHTDVRSDGEYRFRVVYQASDGNVAGTELATHIGVEFPDVPVILMSAFTPAGVARVGVGESLVPVLQKPFEPTQLAELVQLALEHPVPHRGGSAAL